MASYRVSLVTATRFRVVEKLIFPKKARDFSPSPKCPDRLWGPLKPLFSEDWGSVLGVKRQGRDFHHSSRSNAEVKNKWSVTSIPIICLHGANIESFTFYLSLPFYLLNVK
jgi:hypothetical protein